MVNLEDFMSRRVKSLLSSLLSYSILEMNEEDFIIGLSKMPFYCDFGT
jgi:hypothetical protein